MKKYIVGFSCLVFLTGTFLLFTAFSHPSKGSGTSLVSKKKNAGVKIRVSVTQVGGITISACALKLPGVTPYGIHVIKPIGEVEESSLYGCPQTPTTLPFLMDVGDEAYGTLYVEATNNYIDGPHHTITQADLNKGVVDVNIAL